MSTGPSLSSKQRGSVVGPDPPKQVTSSPHIFRSRDRNIGGPPLFYVLSNLTRTVGMTAYGVQLPYSALSAKPFSTR